jgi:hypothetical protein
MAEHKLYLEMRRRRCSQGNLCGWAQGDEAFLAIVLEGKRRNLPLAVFHAVPQF